MKGATFIKEVHEVSIYVDGEGRFIAEIGDRVINKPSLREVEREIGKSTGGLPVFSFEALGGSWPFVLKRYEFTGMDSGRYKDNYRDKNGQRHGTFHNYYKSTPELIARLSDLAERYEAAVQAFSEERRAILDTAGRVSRRDFEKQKKGNDDHAT